MKKRLLTILIALLSTASAFAKDLKSAVRASHLSTNGFYKTFDIESTKWSEQLKIKDDRKEQESQLPIQGKRIFAKRFDAYAVKQAIRSASAEGEVYYINAENENETVILKINEVLEIEIFRKSK